MTSIYARMSQAAHHPRYRLIEIRGATIAPENMNPRAATRRLGISFSILDTYDLWREVWADYGASGIRLDYRRETAEAELRRLNRAAWEAGDYED